MGCSFSSKRLSPKSKIIRIIHMNGFMEEIDYPVTAAEVTGKPTSHFLFTQAQLLLPASTPLKMDTPLEPGRVYFMLPFSLFDSNVSPLDLAPLVRKLAQKAKLRFPTQSSRGGSSGNSSSSRRSILTSAAPSPIGTKTFTWKPILSTIRESSFNRRESDLQENVKVTE